MVRVAKQKVAQLFLSGLGGGHGWRSVDLGVGDPVTAGHT